MSLFRPTVNLVRVDDTENPGGPSTYKLQAVTVTNSTQYVARPYVAGTYQTDGDQLVIKLIIKIDSGVIVNKDYLHPVTHIADLTGVPLGGTNELLRVEIHEEVSGQSQTNDKGSRVLHVASADEDGMPIF